MKDIKWEDGAVCFANGLQHIANGFLDDVLLAYSLTFADFQLNEIRQGDYIEASELDTRQKYNDVVEVFELFGFYKHENHLRYDKYSSLTLAVTRGGYCYTLVSGRQLTYPQLMAIGKLKRAMLDRDEVLIDAVGNTSILKGALGPAKDYTLAGTIEGESTKGSRAYNILESMNIFYDEVEKVWYKKEYL